MTFEEIKLRRLSGHHLLQTADTQTVVKDLCGVQAQFLSHALHGLSIRCDDVDITDLIKSWTNRGTMHLFSVDDLPLFLHRDRSHFLRPQDTLGTDAYLDAVKKAYYAQVILEAIATGTDDRESLKAVCKNNGMTESESKSLFDPWGGMIRALCEQGLICHKAQEKKAYQLCPAFEPMEAQKARLELARRYFTHFGPATVKDAAFFFGWTQAQVKALLQNLPVESFHLDGKDYFTIGRKTLDTELPPCLFLAGFDQLILGYEKTESLFLPRDHLRDIFSLSGIVRPALLVDGNVAGFWNLKNRKLHITRFEDADRDVICSTAESLWPDLKSVSFE